MARNVKANGQINKPLKNKEKTMVKKVVADQVEVWPIGRLHAYERNARQHTDAQIAQIAAAINEWGFTTPVLVDEMGTILAGHGRVAAARHLGLTEVPVVIARDWTEAQKRGYLIADNQITTNSQWDEALLAAEVDNLRSDGFDLTLLGLSSDDLKKLSGQDDDEITVQEVDTSPVADEFWIAVRGPLAQQADALQKLQAVMKDLDSVSVELGTTQLDWS